MSNIDIMVKDIKKELEVYEKLLEEVNKYGKDFTIAILNGKIEACKSFLSIMDKN